MATVTTATRSVEQLEAVYRRDGDRLWRALVTFGCDAELASDCVAEAFAQALRRGAAVRDPEAWVWRTSFRIAAGELKRRSATFPGQPEGSYVDPEPDPELDAELMEALASLPTQQRAAVVLFYYLDAPIVEIARRTGMSQLSVRVNLSRGRARLRQLLGDRHD
jgi:RNA polymerase sigma-70 factor (ECF subfamily)